MDIKVGDIVRFEGRDVRVLRVASSILLSYFGPVRDGLGNLELIKSYDSPKFEVGDSVSILDIPNIERMHYGPGWQYEMTQMIGSTQTVTEVRCDKHLGQRVRLSGWWFCTYHLEPENNYDIV